MGELLKVLKQWMLMGIIFSGILAVLVNSWSCQKNNSGKLEALSVAMVPTELNALFYIAEAQKLFSANGLQVTPKESYDSGASAVAGLLKGEADIALTAEFPIVRQVLKKKNIVCFGTIAKYENTYIIWKSDSGIKTIQDLKGKRVGVTLKTISEFYLGRMLELSGLNIQQITLIDTRPADSEKALINGDVDAEVAWEPWVTQINQHLGKGAVTMSLQGGQYAYWSLVSTSAWIKSHPDLKRRFIMALVQAESYLANNQSKARAIVKKRMKLDDAYLAAIWKRYQFSLSLDQSFIAAMEDEARWMIKNKLTKEKNVPVFLNYIFEDGLKAVNPEAVNIIR